MYMTYLCIDLHVEKFCFPERFALHFCHLAEVRVETRVYAQMYVMFFHIDVCVSNFYDAQRFALQFYHLTEISVKTPACAHKRT